MKRPEGLTTRLLSVSLLGVLVGGLFMFFSVVYTVVDMAIERNFALNADNKQRRVAACLADPAGWKLIDDINEAYAYDAATLSSQNPAAPALDPNLLAELDASEHDLVTSVSFPPNTGRTLVRFGPPGPCELLGVYWRSTASNELRGFGVLIFALLLVLVVAGALAIFVAIRPLLRRIEALATSAEQIGDAEVFRAIEDPAPDALGHLARRIAESHERIVTANDALRSRARALEEHLENVAHDVRTPLAALQLRLEGLLTETAEPEARELLAAAVDDVVYMTGLTENLRLASRLKHGLTTTDHEREVELSVLLRRVVERFTTLGSLRGVKVRGSWPDTPVFVSCDPAAAEQALANLAHNAVIHAESAVTLRLDHVGGGFELAVVDDGPGVAPESLPRLADRHFREDRARSRGPRGSGLGLAIVAEVCQRLAWTLEFERLDPPGLEVSIRGGRRGDPL